MTEFRLLAVGDVCARAGVDFLCERLPSVKRELNIDFCVVNGENAAGGNGITPDIYEDILIHGADVVTLGNHAWDAKTLAPKIDELAYLLRPSNFAPGSPGRGYAPFPSRSGDVLVLNLVGRVAMNPNENPFFELDRILASPEAKSVKYIFADFHAEATSEKLALAHYADGRVSALWGTHTHVQTSDAMILPRGTGYVTDLGMTGAEHSVIGLTPESAIARFRGEPDWRFAAAEGKSKLEGAVFEFADGKCVSVETVRIAAGARR
ncbi:MAG: YmdB family metallophosphoesterase [Oscillospiraceae bacterium]|jgi:metallophosphoesterase (TIGR00282 family)|nr:YmdB family metallophosphoesterase [Oscillospiraceae bacterium]